MRPIATDEVAWYVSVSVGHGKTQKRSNRSRYRLGVTWMGSRNNLQIPRGRGNVWGCPAHCNALWVTVVLYAARKSITASQRHCCSELQCYRLFGITLHRLPWKIPPAMRPLVKIIWPLVPWLRLCSQITDDQRTWFILLNDYGA